MQPDQRRERADRRQLGTDIRTDDGAEDQQVLQRSRQPGAVNAKNAQKQSRQVVHTRREQRHDAAAGKNRGQRAMARRPPQ